MDLEKRKHFEKSLHTHARMHVAQLENKQRQLVARQENYILVRIYADSVLNAELL